MKPIARRSIARTVLLASLAILAVKSASGQGAHTPGTLKLKAVAQPGVIDIYVYQQP